MYLEMPLEGVQRSRRVADKLQIAVAAPAMGLRGSSPPVFAPVPPDFLCKVIQRAWNAKLVVGSIGLMLLLDDGDPLTAKLPSRYAGGNQMTLYNIQQINDMRFLLSK